MRRLAETEVKVNDPAHVTLTELKVVQWKPSSSCIRRHSARHSFGGQKGSGCGLGRSELFEFMYGLQVIHDSACTFTVEECTVVCTLEKAVFAQPEFVFAIRCQLSTMSIDGGGFDLGVDHAPVWLLKSNRRNLLPLESDLVPRDFKQALRLERLD
jgi:hypothetical protein